MSKNADKRFESVPDFVRHAVAEAKLVISEIEKTHIEIEEAALRAANVRISTKGQNQQLHRG